MTDDGTPLELSWSWSSGSSLPIVRYSLEAVNRYWPAISNTQAAMDFVERFRAFHCDSEMDWGWYTVLSEHLVDRHKDKHTHSSPDDGSGSQQFFAFNLIGGHRVPKAYFVLDAAARRQGIAKLDIALKALGTLKLDENVTTAMATFEGYARSERAVVAELEVEMLAIDCITPANSRVKIYVRSRDTAF